MSKQFGLYGKTGKELKTGDKTGSIGKSGVVEKVSLVSRIYVDLFADRSGVRIPHTEWDGRKQGVQLYDHDRDPGEYQNLSGERNYAARIAEMRRLMSR